MSRSRKKKRSGRSAKHVERSKKTNIIIFKFADPLLQCLLIIGYVFSDDGGFCFGRFYLDFVYALLGLGVLSTVANLIFRLEEVRTLPLFRILFLACFLFLSAIFYRTDFTDLCPIPFGFGKIPDKYNLINLCLLGLSFWYNIICFRELQAVLKSIGHEDE